ncbi:MAG: class I adenylate cyclase [Gammaproteobacteria bacterium]|nr:class I adenylate cyclase [Gammaproteobacteria bacterium]
MTPRTKTHHQKTTDKFYLENLDHKKILRKFLRLNNLKLQRTQESLKQRQAEFLQLLPLLFHVNHPSLPGFVSTQCPSGISKFTPDKDSIRYARKISKSFEYKRRAYRQYDIHALYLMGSTGTIAYSDKSDFDIWVCHREDLTQIELKELQIKTEHLTQWCLEFHLEVNFFLIHTDNFRQGKIDKLSSESSGTTQHLLLLEEFYRTSMLLVGRYPIWWIVPPQFEKEYDEYVENIIHKRLLNEHDFLNFGSINHILAEEFYGATLWHIYKGIDSPYKSILKLLLMECYAKEHPNINLLCFQFKQLIYEKETPDINELDPYIMMMDKITTHLIAENSLNRLDLARQCLYLKVNESLTELKTAPSHSWRHTIMNDLVSQWQWKQPKLLLLDGRNQWKIDEVSKEHRNIIESLTYSYRKLSDYFRYQNKDIRISKRDLHILGRKLYAAFENRAGKIEVIGHDTEIDLYEPHVSLHTISSKSKSHSNKDTGWAMYVGAFNSLSKTSPPPIKKSTHLLKLLCWGFFNRVINNQTNFILSKDIEVLNAREIKQIIETLENVFPEATPGRAGMEELVKPAQLNLNILFLNIGIDPFLKYHSSGTQITTKQTNALNYSSMHENLLITIDQVLLTSWREVMTQHFEGETGLLECLCHYLKWNHETEIAQNSSIPKRPTLVCCFSSVRGDAISRCISELFNNVLDAFHGDDKAFNTRYLFSVEESFYILWQDESGTKYQKIPDQKELLRELSYPLAKFNSLTIDPDFSDFKVLKLIYSKNKENHIQLFYQNHRKTADIYIIDERGSLYHQTTDIESNSIHINHFVLFLDSVVNRLSYSSSYFDSSYDNVMDSTFEDSLTLSLAALNLDEPEIDLQLEVFEIQKQSPGQLILEEQFSKLQSMPAQFFRIQVIADLNKDGSRRYVIYANDKEFNSFEYGRDIYKKVAEEVITTRQSKQRYPIYITDIDLSPELREAESSHGIQSTQLLKFKHEIERRLNQAIKNL